MQTLAVCALSSFAANLEMALMIAIDCWTACVTRWPYVLGSDMISPIAGVWCPLSNLCGSPDWNWFTHLVRHWIELTLLLVVVRYRLKLPHCEALQIGTGPSQRL